jgi:hypothetical protein
MEINCAGGAVNLFCDPGTEKFQVGCSLFRAQPSNIHVRLGWRVFVYVCWFVCLYVVVVFLFYF